MNNLKQTLLEYVKSFDFDTLSELQLKKLFPILNPVQKDFYDDYFKLRGISNSQNAVVPILEHNGDAIIFREIVKGNIKLPTENQMFDKGIEQSVLDLGISQESVTAIYNIEISERNISKGKAEILLCLFIKNINKYNQAIPGKYNCDINTTNMSIEAKGNYSRPNNQSELNKLRSDEHLSKYGKNLSLLENNKTVERTCNTLLKLTDSEDKTLDIIGEAICQVPLVISQDDGKKKTKIEIKLLNKEEQNEFIVFLKNHKEDFFENNLVKKFKKTPTSRQWSTNLITIWGVFDIYIYANKLEPFDKLLMTLKTKNGHIKEKVFDKNIFKSFESIYENFCPYVTFDAFPRIGNFREAVVKMSLK